MLRVPLEQIYLHVKSLGYNDVKLFLSKVKEINYLYFFLSDINDLLGLESTNYF